MSTQPAGIPLITSEVGSSIALAPGDELVVTVDRPMVVRLVKEHSREPVDANLAKEWFDQRHLRSEVQRLRNDKRGLNYRLERALEMLEQQFGVRQGDLP